MKNIRFWFQNARPVSLPQSVMPALVAAFAATKYTDFRWYLALLAILGICFAHLSLNLFDDYFDYKNAEQGDRSALAREGIRAMTAKCLPLQEGVVTAKQYCAAACIFGAVAAAFGVPILLLRGPAVLWVVLGVAVLGLFYSAPPLKLGYHGLGELIIGAIFGPAIFIGMHLAASGEFHTRDVLLSVAVGVIVICILYVHSIMDYAADQKAGKKTLAWLVGRKNMTIAYVVLGVLIFLPYALMLLGILLRFFALYYIVTLLAFPWSLDLFLSMLAFRKDPYAAVEKKWWYGSFQMWDAICENHLDWFMLRWLLAQRICMVFSLLCILASIAQMVVNAMNLLS